MPRLTNSLPKYRKHKATGKAIVVLDGKTFYLGPYGTKTSRNEYDRHVGEWQQNGRRLPVPESVPLTVSQLCAEYWRFSKAYYVKNGRPTDEQAGIKAAINHITAIYARTYVTDFGPLAMEAVRVPASAQTPRTNRWRLFFIVQIFLRLTAIQIAI